MYNPIFLNHSCRSVDYIFNIFDKVTLIMRKIMRSIIYIFFYCYTSKGVNVRALAY